MTTTCLYPESISPDASTAYILVENHKTDAEGNATVLRELYGPEDDCLATFSLQENGVCVKNSTELEWK